MSFTSVTLKAANESEQEAIGAHLATAISWPLVAFLYGDLGAGKTTLVRGVMRGLGHVGRVKSPTYTLMEPYRFGERTCYHLDLYRIADPGEIEFLGLRDLLGEATLLLVEWPERGEADLPPPDLEIRIRYAGTGRELCLTACSAAGEAALRRLARTRIASGFQPDSSPA